MTPVVRAEQFQNVQFESGSPSMRQVRVIGIAILLAISAGFSASRAEYPDRPIKLIVAWPPGGAADMVGRLMADQLSRSLNNSVVVENRPGANGNIGTELFVRLLPDGYSLQIATAEALGINPLLYKLHYDAERDFDLIALLAQSTFVLAVRASLPVNNLEEFIALAKSSPGKLTIGNYGIGSTSHLTAAAFELSADVSFLHVPYRGLNPVINALLTGEIDAAFASAGNVIGLQQSGQLKILGSASLKRLAAAPGVPTFSEQGVEGFVAGNWYGIVAPKGLAVEAKKRLIEAVQEIAASKSFLESATAGSLEMHYLNAEEFGQFLRVERDRWGEIVTKEHIQVGGDQ